MLNITATLLWLLITACILVPLDKALRVKPDRNEPPFIPAALPYCGHILGIFWYKLQYYAKLSARHPLDIYSLAMPGGRLYVVNSPDLVSSVQRQPRTLSFWYLEAKFTTVLGGLSKRTGEMLRSNVHGEHGKQGLFLDGMRASHKAIISGEELRRMSHAAVQMVAEALDRLEADEGTRNIDLWKWVEHETMLVTTGSFYGPENPYRNEKVEKGFWDFSSNTIMLLAGIIPQILAPKGYAGREKVVAGFQKYFATSGHKTASNLIQEQIEILERYGVGSEDIARFESVRGFAILRNALPTAFWTLYHVFATPRILARVREQVTTILTVDNTNTDTRYCTIDLARLDEAPVLASVVQESLRMYALGASARIVLQDTMLQSRWLLKKDSYVFMPNRATHFDTTSWGPSANTFDAQRFEHIKSGRDTVAPGAFQGFGGGQNSCPGRHFAMMQIVALVAMMALRFDVMSAMEKMDGDDWVIPVQDERDMSLVISPPKGEVLVEVVPRQGWEGRQWVFKL